MTLAAAYAGGVLTLFAPCAALILPGFLAYATAEKQNLLGRTAIFTLGLVVALTPLGFLAGSLGALLRQYQYQVTVAMGLLVALMGVLQIFGFNSFSAPNAGTSASKSAPVGYVPGVNLGLARSGGRGGGSDCRTAAVEISSGATSEVAGSRASAVAVFGMGVGYGLAGVGCSGPILGAMLALSGIGGDPVAGGFMMMAYALGMATPIVMLTLLWDGIVSRHPQWLKPRVVTVLGRQTTRGAVVSGVLFVLLGALLVVTGGHNFLPALMSSATQVQIESWLLSALTAVPWWLFAALAAVVVSLLWAWNRYYRR